MPYFFSKNNLSQDDIVEISGEEARHILLAHRSKKGERVKLQGPDKKRFIGEILDIQKGLLKLLVVEELSVPKEPKILTNLFQAVVSEKSLDFIFQKGTELGLEKIILFNSQNTAVKLTKEKFEAKKSRWEKIIQESAKQCERAVWPRLEFCVDLTTAQKEMAKYNQVFIADLKGKKLKALSPDAVMVALVVGPEGGFAKTELEQMEKLLNYEKINLGPVLLRAETASLAGVAIIHNLI